MSEPKPMSEELERKAEKLATELGRHYGDGAEALVRELVAEVRRLRAEVQQSAPAEAWEEIQWRLLKTQEQLAVAREALGWYADKIHYDEEFGCGAWVKPDTFEEDGGWRARAALKKLEAPADGK